MLITLKIVNMDDDSTQEDLGECATDSPSRACQMYEPELDSWLEKGYRAELVWE